MAARIYRDAKTLPNIDKLTGIKLDIPTEHLIVGAISGILILFLLSKVLHVKTPLSK